MDDRSWPALPAEPPLEILEWPHPLLRAPSQVVVDFTDTLARWVDLMWTTMYDAEGVGLAAPQIGLPARLFVMDCDIHSTSQGPVVCVNPKLSNHEGEIDSVEGCLSFPGLRVTLPRASKVTLSAQDLSGRTFELELGNLDAICAQHELDHLNGQSFLDHLGPLEKRHALDQYLQELIALQEQRHRSSIALTIDRVTALLHSPLSDQRPET
jgi:peptide deformylase